LSSIAPFFKVSNRMSNFSMSCSDSFGNIMSFKLGANGFGLGDRLRNEACAKPVLVAGGIFSTKLQSKH